ncbi:hypothetical protein SAMN05192558_103522 [Actinokineospora alba]|uniref:Uncharacterized protein n=1 Tax=Actinokineospora alba TaxID=504798 RepID=A0A1H0KKU9_9PSEU|nr:hypothetical protein [Actinokineospora alba]TDP67866.1 hypothetical protein C8E96_3420 [Actinokineospora alba]SDH87855.1 hypothetical protein SAMN05421871_102527 [Actinokineospora alba]SDO56436.1 hypothetical protein SAMN05192558_103522 [Actinokineospora alba]
MTYPQLPYPDDRPPYGPTIQYGGDFPPPSPKKSGPVIAALAAGVTVLGLGVTGFIAPGFLVSEQTPTAPPTTVTTTSTKPSDDPKDFLKTLVSALDTRDATALTDLACELKRPSVSTVIDNASAINQVTLLDTKKISARRATAIVSITTDVRRAKVELTVTRKDDTWCWSDARPAERTRPTTSRPTPTTTTTPDSPTAGGKPVAPEALAVMQKFLDSVNAGDAATAKSLLCTDAIATPQKVDELVGYQPNLKIDTGMDGISSGKESVQLYLSGTAKGQRLNGHAANLWATSYNSPWCIHAFRAVVV